MRYKNTTGPSPSRGGLVTATDPGPIAGLALIFVLGCAMAYRLRQLAKQQIINRIHPIGFVVCYVWVLAYSISDTVNAPATVYLRLLSAAAGLWLAGWVFTAVVYDKLRHCVGRDRHGRDPEDRSMFADDL